MAKKISQLTQATQVKSDDVTVIVQDGETKKLPLNMMVTKQDIEDKKVAGLAKLDEIEATYENDTYTPTITVKNKSSVKVGEGDGVDYSANVMDGPAKSAILKGQTLVNLAIDNSVEFTTNDSWKHTQIKGKMLSTTKNYLVKFNSSQDYRGYVHLRDLSTNTYITDSILKNFKKGSNVVLLSEFLRNDLESFSNIIITFYADNNATAPLTITNIMLIEYQDGMENWGIPYFEGMQSVKLPVLTTTGKNLYDGELQQGGWSTSTGLFNEFKESVCSINPIKVQEDAYLRLSQYGEVTYNGVILFFCYDVNNKYLGYIDNGEQVLKNTDYVHFRIYDANSTSQEVNPNIKIQVEASSISTSYEPFKTNILTVNEDVTLRSNGSVCDELDLLTGKLTQRIDEDGEILTQEVVKTVDLMPSGTHPSTTPYCWKNGHIQLSSSGLLPNLEYSVVTSRAGQINQNATMIVKNDKRIFDLEILLAGGLVNTTYQALTLQNQVETGLSKVSLNSETEPDYLLYHMIMKLIEEKAYKLDDLTEKVSVFYLYEKLSDEQFETIYSALYPFVEDEIIEEPVVEELPEVVEDEVIM